MNYYTHAQLVNLCAVSSTTMRWDYFINSLVYKYDSLSWATTTQEGLVSLGTDAAAILRSVPVAGQSRKVASIHQLPLINLNVSGVETAIGTTTGVALVGRGLTCTPRTTTVSGYTRTHFYLQNTSVPYNSDTYIDITEAVANSGNYRFNIGSAYLGRMKVDAGATLGYLSAQIDGSLQVVANQLGLRSIDSNSIDYVLDASGNHWDLRLDGTSLVVGAGGLSLNNPTTYVMTTGAQNVGGVKTFTSLPATALAPAAGSDLTNKTYVDGLDALNVHTTGAEGIAGVKTFSSFPVTPSSAPTTAYQVANKQYVDDALAAYAINDTGWIELDNGGGADGLPQIGGAPYVLSTQIPVPAANQFIDVIECTAYNNYDAAALTLGGADLLALKYTGGTSIASWTNAFVISAADRIDTGNQTTYFTKVAGQTLELTTLAGNAIGGGGVTTTISVRILYRLITF